MTSVKDQITIASDIIDRLLLQSSEDKSFSAQQISLNLRHLTEAVVLGIAGYLDEEMSYKLLGKAMQTIDANDKYRELTRFHGLQKISVSHYSLDGDGAERLMLKYIVLLMQMRSLVKSELNLDILQNIEAYPLDQDPGLTHYYQSISKEIIKSRDLGSPIDSDAERYYIDSIRPFIVERKVFYEVTYRNANNYSTKQDRLIAFTDRSIDTNYATKLWIQTSNIHVAQQALPIDIIIDHEVSIRPIELLNLARFYNSAETAISTSSAEYKNLSVLLTEKRLNLLELVLSSEQNFQHYIGRISHKAKRQQITQTLQSCRATLLSNRQGQNILRYVLFTLDNKTIKQQIPSRYDKRMQGDLNISSKCYPFERMPFTFSLPGHNPKIIDLLACIPTQGREDELLHRKVRNRITQTGEIYVPVKELATIEDKADAHADLDPLISKFNRGVGHFREKEMTVAMNHIAIAEYEQNLSKIIKWLRSHENHDLNYSISVKTWLEQNGLIAEAEASKPLPRGFDDPLKVEYLTKLFSDSKVAFIYGPAGTGKSTMVDIVAKYFSNEEKLFLAHTKTAVDNLKRRVSEHQNSKFQTLASYLNQHRNRHYGLLVVDECSTVNNKQILQIFEKNEFDRILLVGDNYQIESIQFGNWFEFIKSIHEGQVKKKQLTEFSVFELSTPFRAKNDYLTELWKSVRDLNGEIEERLSKKGFTQKLDDEFFQPYNSSRDEITLCLNYDGLYGINNINRFMQGTNPSNPILWNSGTYKVGDPVLFFDSYRLTKLVHNNLKGKIVDILTDSARERIWFDIEVDRPEIDIRGIQDQGGFHLKGSVIRIFVDRLQNTDNDNDDASDAIPFQIAYAISIHKAQGLEYDTVRIVVTADSEEKITHNIFYTAITRARESLTIYWSPESQKKVIEKFARPRGSKTLGLLKARNLI